MTALASNPARTLPTPEEAAALFTTERDHLLNVVRRMSGVADLAWREDVVQWVFLQALQKIEEGQPFLETSLWQYVCWRARNRIIDLRRQSEWTLMQDLARPEEGELAAQIAASEPTPLEEAVDQERRQRKQRLLSEILQEYSRQCQSQERMLSGKEVLERMLRGESAEQTAAAMGMERNAVDKARRDARRRLRELLRKHDAHQTVFQTFYRREMAHPFQGRRKNSGQVEAPTVGELFHFVLNQAGALCPEEQRLRGYLAQPEDAAFADIRYHVAQAGCPLCQGVLAAWSA